MKIRLNELAHLLGAEAFTAGDALRDLQPEFDSRRIAAGSQVLFFAFGEKGRASCEDAYRKGCRHFVLSRLPEPEHDDAFYFLTPDPLQALQDLAAAHRASFRIPIIGITGSNGKTIVKEWLGQILSRRMRVTQNPGSYNSQIGVPVSVLHLNEDTEIGVFEAGISRPGEMQRLERIIQPETGILTFIGDAHAENFESEQAKFLEKTQLFQHCKILIAEKEAPHTKTLHTLFPEKELLSVSLQDKEASVYIKAATDKEVEIWQNGHRLLRSAFFRTDRTSLLNLALALAAALHYGVSAELLGTVIPLLHPPEGRLRIQNGINGSMLLNDTYSADFQSLKIAMEELHRMPVQLKRSLILSDFADNVPGEKLYAEIARLANSYQFEKVILIGPEISRYASLFNGFSTSFAQTGDLLAELNPASFVQEAILIKGARSFGLERVAAILEEKNHECVLEINLDAISHNFKHYRNLAGKARLMVMVKAFSYGAGAVEMARHLQYLGADYLAVAYADEGVQLRQGGIQLPIMVMSPEIPSVSALVNYDLEPEIYSFRSLHFLIQGLQELGRGAAGVHIKIDSGMHRLGFMPEETEALAELLAANPQIRVRSIFTHLAAADDPAMDDFSKEQLRRFYESADYLSEHLGIRPLLHAQNTAGLERLHPRAMDMARLGIGLYGIAADPAQQVFLKNAVSFKTRIAAIRNIEEPETVGYGRRGKIKGKARIATISVGYADGFPRKLGLGRYQVKIGDHLCETLGSVCMDMCMIDVTGIPCSEGDEVVLFGENPDIHAMARALDTIAYEVLTSIGQRVKRIYIRE